MITDTQAEQFERDGAVTIDGPFADSHIEALGRMFEEVKEWDDYSRFEPELLEVFQHPFCEEVAKRVLRADEVEFMGGVMRQRKPGAEVSPEHLDIMLNRKSFEEVPRHMWASLLLWLTPVTPDRGPFMYRPGSHRQIAEDRGDLPLVIGNVWKEDMPDLPYAELAPVLVESAGQISVLTTATAHGPSKVTGPHPRKVIFLGFKAKGLEFQSSDTYREKNQKFERYRRALREHFREDRRHLIPV